VKLTKAYIITYGTFVISAAPWIAYNAWVTRDIPGGVNEALEGFVLYLLMAIPITIGLTAMVYLGSVFDKSILGARPLVVVAAVTSTLLMYTESLCPICGYYLELGISLAVVGMFIVARRLVSSTH
jgi:hypothetical protein